MAEDFDITDLCKEATQAFFRGDIDEYAEVMYSGAGFKWWSMVVINDE